LESFILDQVILKVFNQGAACAGFYALFSILYFAIFLPRKFGKDIPLVGQWFMSLFFPISFALAIEQVKFLKDF